jgi:hypothetical protein
MQARPRLGIMLFAAVHEAACGTSHRFAALPKLGRIGVKADMP